jgi:hypothetical protein
VYSSFRVSITTFSSKISCVCWLTSSISSLICFSCFRCCSLNGSFLGSLSDSYSEFSELLPGINSCLDCSFPCSSDSSSPNLDGALLTLPRWVMYSAVVYTFCALRSAGAHGNGLLPSCSVFRLLIENQLCLRLALNTTGRASPTRSIYSLCYGVLRDIIPQPSTQGLV